MGASFFVGLNLKMNVACAQRFGKRNLKQWQQSPKNSSNRSETVCSMFCIRMQYLAHFFLFRCAVFTGLSPILGGVIKANIVALGDGHRRLS